MYPGQEIDLRARWQNWLKRNLHIWVKISWDRLARNASGVFLKLNRCVYPVILWAFKCNTVEFWKSSKPSHHRPIISVLKGYSDNDPSSFWCPRVRARKHRSLTWMMAPPLRQLVYIQSFSCSCWFTGQLSSFATPFTQLICNMADIWQLSAGGTPT